MPNRRLPFSKVLFKGAFIYNPVLTQAIGVCTIVAICSTLKISLVSSAVLSMLLIFCETLASLLLKKIARWLRIALYMVICIAILIPTMIIMDSKLSEISASMGIFLPLLAVNSLVVIRCENFAVKNSPKLAFFDAVAGAIGYSVVAVIIGALREILAFGSVFGKTINMSFKLSGLALPFGGMFLLGFISAFQKWIIQKKFRGQPTNIFNLSSSLEQPVLRDDGLLSGYGKLKFMRDNEILEAEDNSDLEDTLSVIKHRSKFVNNEEDGK